MQCKKDNFVFVFYIVIFFILQIKDASEVTDMNNSLWVFEKETFNSLQMI